MGVVFSWSWLFFFGKTDRQSKAGQGRAGQARHEEEKITAAISHTQQKALAIDIIQRRRH